MDIRKLNSEQIKKLVNSKNFPIIFKTLDEKSQKLLKPYLKHKKPTVKQTIKQAAKSVKEWVAEGFPVVSSAVYEERLAICKTCEFWKAINTPLVTGVCTKCRCTNAKLKLATEECPLPKPKWDREV